MKLRLQPIHVYCLHHVCSKYDSNYMNHGDWMNIEEFKQKVIMKQREGVEFISLKEAYNHISKDWIRSKKYAVLTFDDGYASLKEILPWLKERQIPITLFINGKYLDGKSYRKNSNEKYLTQEELWALASPTIEVGNHGWEHVSVAEMTDEEFEKSIEKNVMLLSKHPNYVSFMAYTYGHHRKKADAYLLHQCLVPVYIDGMKNYNNNEVIHRELFDYKKNY